MTQPEVEIRKAWRHIAGGDHEQLLAALLIRYGEPHRRYHTATHIMMVVRDVQAGAAALGRQATPELIAAALYHDAIYEPRADDNEAHSAALAVRDLGDVGWAGDRCSSVESMIMATAGHVHAGAAVDTDVETSILLDADLAILGADPTAYQAYANGVRIEYSFVDDAGWRTGRTAVLRSFIDRERIFLTDHMYDRAEHRARANLEAELATLHRR